MEEQILIIFNGPPGTGKDEACEFLSSQFGFKHIEFKHFLFIETYKYFNVSKEWFMKDYNIREVKETIKEPRLGNRTRREALIHVSEDIIKPRYGKDFFGIKAFETIDGISSYCFSDGGFIEEVEVLINNLGTVNICVVQLYRDGCNFSSDSRKYMNGDIQEIYGTKSDSKCSHLYHEKHLPIRTYKIYNNGALGEFHNTIKTIIRRERDVVRKEKSRLFSRKPI